MSGCLPMIQSVTSSASRPFSLVATVILAVVFASVPSGLIAQQGTTAAERQSPNRTFRVQVNSVEVDVTVADEAGKFVRDLEPADFQIVEDGKPQTIGTFALVDLPTQTSVLRSPLEGRPIEIEPDVRSNEQAADGRVYVIVLDDLHTHPRRSTRARLVARRFLEQYFAPGDLGAVVYTSGRSDASQEFTTSQRLLLEAVGKFTGRKLRSSVLTGLEEFERMRGAPGATNRANPRLYRIQDPLESQRADAARRMLQTLERLGELVDAVRRRRKAVLLVSEGIDYDVEGGVAQTTSGLSTFTSPSAAGVRQDMRDAINAAVRGTATIYAVDPRGLAGPGDVIEMSTLPRNPLLGLSPTAFEDEIRRSQDTLRVLAEETGGVAAVSSNDFSDIFERVVRDSSTYYMLAYTSTNEKRDGRFRRIEVRVNRPDVQVRARLGYTAPSGRTDPAADSLASGAGSLPPLRDALNSPVPVPGLVMRAFAVPFKAMADPSVMIGVEIEGDRFRFEEKEGLYTDTVHVVLATLDRDGEFHAHDRHTVEMQLKPQTYDAVRTHGVRLMFRLTLPPGRYQIRAAAHEIGAGATGSVHYDLEVPEFEPQPLAMSGIVLTSTGSGRTPTARPDARLGAVLGSPPTAARRFETAERISAYLEIYPGPNPPITDIITSLIAPDGRAVFRSEDQVSADTLREAVNGYGWIVPIPLANLPTGKYVLRMEARSRQAETDASLVRQLPIEVLPAESPAR